jgi:BCD family chlorophyll transporter-like MFS transporter
MLINGVALWKQERRRPARTARGLPRPSFGQAWTEFRRQDRAIRRLVALGLGTIGFSMQDILLEPYGGQILHLSVGQTTALTAFLAIGGFAGFALAARWLGRGLDPFRLAGFGAVGGSMAFAALALSAPLDSRPLFVLGTGLVGFSAGLFAHATLTAAMAGEPRGQVGLALGIWGAVQATAAGTAVAAGGILRDLVCALAAAGRLGPTLGHASIGYGAVYEFEILLLFATLVALGPLVRVSPARDGALPFHPALATATPTGREA